MTYLYTCSAGTRVCKFTLGQGSGEDFHIPAAVIRNHVNGGSISSQRHLIHFTIIKRLSWPSLAHMWGLESYLFIHT